jgi:dolichol-phosphate mannosyltransferase
MLDVLKGGADLVVGTRYAPDGSAKAGFSPLRNWGSKTAAGLAKRLLQFDLTDPMSGFFMIRRRLVEDIAGSLWTHGFKLLLDIVVTSPTKLKTVELPYAFRTRPAGSSKMDALVTFQYLEFLVSKATRGLIPPRFMMFALVGATGIGVHLGTLGFLHSFLGWRFVLAQLGATFVAMTSNFILNNTFTYSDRRLSGFAFLTGLLSFYFVCSFGTLANVSVAGFVYSLVHSAPLISGLAGALMSAVFNYSASKALTWRET